MRITEEVFDHVLRLLKQGKMSQRTVARVVGISRATVAKIVGGKFRPCRPRDDHNEHESWRPTGPIARCPTCGGRVYMPCQLCHIRALKQADRRKAQPQTSRREQRQPRVAWPTR